MSFSEIFEFIVVSHFIGFKLVIVCMLFSTFGNILEPTSHWLEVIFSIITVLSGLMLFTLLIGNIQVSKGCLWCCQ